MGIFKAEIQGCLLSFHFTKGHQQKGTLYVVNLTFTYALFNTRCSSYYHNFRIFIIQDDITPDLVMMSVKVIDQKEEMEFSSIQAITRFKAVFGETANVGIRDKFPKLEVKNAC